MRRTLTAPSRSALLSLGAMVGTAALVGAGLVAAGSAQAAVDSQTFVPAGAEQSYVVPAGATSVTVTVTGAPGAAHEYGPPGGEGRVVTADLPVAPGQTLYVEVGGAGVGTVGGFNGGGAGGYRGPDAGYLGGAGGGASDIRTCPAAGPCSPGSSLDSRLIVAAGGGGGGINPAGNADDPAPDSIYFPDGGKAGTLVAGGAGGAAGNDGAPGSPGLYGVGGAGADGVGSGTPGGGGGGGGVYGGGGGGSGGSGGGGGGGSSYVAANATNVSLGYDATRAPSITITVDAVPTITTQPADATVTAGDTATFTAAASGNPAATVQWQVFTNGGSAWADLAGETSGTLTLTGTTVGMTGDQYRAVFTNTYGGTDHTATTNPATLTVNPASSAPMVTTQPADATVTAGGTATFTAAASGNPAATVQWQVFTNGGSAWADLAGETSGTLTLTGTTVGMTGDQYRAVFTNTYGGTDHTATTNPATLTVNAAPAVTTQPADATVTAGGTATFTAAASGNPAATVQWQVFTNGGSAWADLAGETSGTLTLTGTTVGMSGNQYRAVFTNTYGGTDHTATTNPATLTVNAAPTTTGPPASTTRLGGADRIATAVAISQDAYPAAHSARAVVLASSTRPWDALTGAPLAAQLGAPLLLTDDGALSAATRAEIERVLTAGRPVYVLGGPQAMAPAIGTSVTAAGFPVHRIAGADRYTTAIAIAHSLGDPAAVMLADGTNFPDALSIGPAAIAGRAAILLTRGDHQVPTVTAYLGGHPTSAIGGPACAASPAATCVMGADRYATSVAVAKRFFGNSVKAVGVASGVAFPDALAAGPSLGIHQGPLLLIPPTGALPDSIAGLLSLYKGSHAPDLYVYGGPLALPDSQVSQVSHALS